MTVRPPRAATRHAVRRATALVLAAGSVLAVTGTATAASTASSTASPAVRAAASELAWHRSAPKASYTVDSAQLARGLYQSAYSERNHVLWATRSVGRPPVTESALLKVDPKSLKVKASYAPPVTDAATGTVEAVYGIAVDDEHNTVWTTNTRNNTVSVFSQRTGEHLASLPNVNHAREIVVDTKHDLAWASAYSDGSLVAFDTRTFKEKKRVTVEGSGPTGLVVNERSGAVYAADLTNNRIIEVGRRATAPRLIPAGNGPMGVALSRDGRTAYTADQTGGTVSVVDLRKAVVTKTVATGAGAKSVATDDRSGRIFVTNRGSGTTTVVDPRKGTVVADLPTGVNANQVVVRRGTAYVLDKAAEGPDKLDSVHRIRAGR